MYPFYIFMHLYYLTSEFPVACYREFHYRGDMVLEWVVNNTNKVRSIFLEDSVLNGYLSNFNEFI